MTDYIRIIEYPIISVVNNGSGYIYVCKCKFDNNKTVFFKGEKSISPLINDKNFKFKIILYKNKKRIKYKSYYNDPWGELPHDWTGEITPISPSKVFELLL